MTNRADIVIWQPHVDAVSVQLRWRDVAYHAARPNRFAAHPFFVVTPAGLPQRDALLAELMLRRIRLQGGPVTIRDWPRTATRLFARRRTYEHLARAAAYERLWRTIGGGGELWALGGIRDYVRLLTLKTELRSVFPPEAIDLHIHLPGRRYASDALLQQFHVPDPQNLATERWLLRGSQKP